MKNRILLTSVFVLIILVVGGIILYINLSQTSSDSSAGISNSKDTINGVYVERGVEKLAQLAKPAVENYVNQNTSESTKSRNDRLAKYFSSDSPVYSYAPDTVNNTIDRTTATVTSITSWAMEGDGKMLIAETNTTYFYKGGSTSIQQTYWIILAKDNNGSLKPYDIGIKQ